MKLNAGNERLKHHYVAYLRGARQLGEHSIDQVLKALDRFEEYTHRRSFREFRTEQASGFKKYLAAANGKGSNQRLSRVTTTSTLYALRDFIVWLADQKGFRNRLVRSDADYFKPSRRDEAIARAPRPMLVPTIEQVRTMLAAMPALSPVDRRNRALVAFTMVTGARDNATASVRLKHLNLNDRQLFQDAREVRTKFGKSFPTWFFPVGRTSPALSWIGSGNWNRCTDLALTTRCFRRPKFPSAPLARSCRRASSESAGQTPIRYERYLGRRVRSPSSQISSRIASATPWRNWEATSA